MLNIPKIKKSLTGKSVKDFLWLFIIIINILLSLEFSEREVGYREVVVDGSRTQLLNLNGSISMQ